MKLYSDGELAEILNQEIFHQISEAADSLGLECYVVGGYVRDIFRKAWNTKWSLLEPGKRATVTTRANL